MKLNYKVLGDGRPLLVLHGLFGSLDNWMTLAKSWASDYRVFLIDQRNHGKSPQSEIFTYKVMAEDLKEFILEHEIEKPIILGHSMGGKTAMEFAVNYPDLLSTLVVVDIAPVSYSVHHYPIIDALESIDLKNLESRNAADKQLSQKIPEMGVRQFLLKNLYRTKQGGFDWRFNLHAIKEAIVPISEWNISKQRYEGRTLFIKGEKSDYINASHASQIMEKFPNYDLVEIEGAGHWVHAEAKEAFSTTVLNFLKNK